jgi:hypothetical protein
MIPGSVSFIDGSALDGIPLDSISFSPDNMRFRYREGFLEDFDRSTIYRCVGSFHSIVIPSSVVVLGKSSFAYCWLLESVTFESGSQLERIDEKAFFKSGLKSIEIPSSVVALGKRSFYGCQRLESVRFESGSRLERIDESMFERSHVSFWSVSQAFTWSRRSGKPETIPEGFSGHNS